MLDYRIETFHILCKVLNYREAANVLHITQPAVTQHIQYLENRFNCKLFTYKNRQLSITPAGQLLEEYVASAKQNEQDFLQKLSGVEHLELKIGATKTIGDYVINGHIRKFLDRGYGLNLVVDNTRNLLQMLDDSKLDFAIIEGYFDKQRYGWQLYREEPFVGICHKDHPFCGKEVPMKDIFRETIIHREAGSGTREILERKLAGYNESLTNFQHNICISSFKLILEAVKHAQGISFVYNVLADSDPELGKFTLQREPIVREFNVVYLKHTDPSDKIRRFLEE